MVENGSASSLEPDQIVSAPCDVEKASRQSAPLAEALLGARVGDQLPFAGKDDALEVLEIEAIT